MCWNWCDGESLRRLGFHAEDISSRCLLRTKQGWDFAPRKEKKVKFEVFNVMFSELLRLLRALTVSNKGSWRDFSSTLALFFSKGKLSWISSLKHKHASGERKAHLRLEHNWIVPVNRPAARHASDKVNTVWFIGVLIYMARLTASCVCFNSLCLSSPWKMNSPIRLDNSRSIIRPVWSTEIERPKPWSYIQRE